jgi:hypothetical protein
MELLNSNEVRGWLQTNETSFSNSLRQYIYRHGDQNCGDGTETSGVFTGKNYCDVATLILKSNLQQTFGEPITWIVAANVRRLGERRSLFNIFPEFRTHVWLRFIDDKGVDYFIDPTYGQIKPGADNIVIDRVEAESQYYDWQEPPYPALFDLSRYPSMERYIIKSQAVKT